MIHQVGGDSDRIYKNAVPIAISDVFDRKIYTL